MSVVLHDFYSSCTVSLFYSTNIHYTLNKFYSAVSWGYPEICIVLNSSAPVDLDEFDKFMV